MGLKLKRAYEPAATSDGARYLVDRLWPRGLSKHRARIDGWLQDLAPSMTLRVWFSHRPERWREFKRRYRVELRARAAELDQLAKKARRHSVTLVYAARNQRISHAIVLREQILRRLHPTQSKQRPR